MPVHGTGRHDLAGVGEAEIAAPIFDDLGHSVGAIGVVGFWPKGSGKSAVAIEQARLPDRDTADRLSRRALRETGQNVVGIVAALQASDITARTPDPAERSVAERVLAAASEVLAEKGAEAGVPEIAARAGVGQGTVYRCFPTKEQLIGAVLTERLRWGFLRTRISWRKEPPQTEHYR